MFEFASEILLGRIAAFYGFSIRRRSDFGCRFRPRPADPQPDLGRPYQAGGHRTRRARYARRSDYQDRARSRGALSAPFAKRPDASVATNGLREAPPLRSSPREPCSIRIRDRQLLGREAGDHPLAALFGDHDLLLDARRGEAVGGRAVGPRRLPGQADGDQQPAAKISRAERSKGTLPRRLAQLGAGRRGSQPDGEPRPHACLVWGPRPNSQGFRGTAYSAGGSP